MRNGLRVLAQPSARYRGRQVPRGGVARGRQGRCRSRSDRGICRPEAGRRLSRDSVFCTLSVAKQFTNVLALSLVERGLLRLHAPIAELLPQFAHVGSQKVNLWHLLTHTSGICSAFPRVPPEIVCSIEQLTNFAASQKLESLPGEQVNYSDLRRALGHCSACLRADGRGRTYSQMLEEEIFAPLEMRDTSLSLRKTWKPATVRSKQHGAAAAPCLLKPSKE